MGPLGQRHQACADQNRVTRRQLIAGFVRHFRSKPGGGIRVAAWVAAWAGGCSADVPGRVFGRILPPSDLLHARTGVTQLVLFSKVGALPSSSGASCHSVPRSWHSEPSRPAYWPSQPGHSAERRPDAYSSEVQQRALTRAAILRPRPPFHQEEAISATAVPVVRDEEAAGSNPATPTASSLVNTLPSDHVRLPRGDMPESGSAGVRFWERPGRD